MMRTKKQIEAEIAERVTRFKKDFIGRGPLETKVYIFDDMVVARMKDTLTPAERNLADQVDCIQCWEAIKEIRSLLIEQGRDQLEAIIYDTLKVKVVSLHNDVSTRTGESVILFILDREPEFEQPDCWRK